jgi:uncharacterized protein (TIGR02145 family)
MGLSLHAQDYQISFAGTGASNTVTTVKVENLTQGKNLTLRGDQILRLKANITDISEVVINQVNGIRFYPNPMYDYAFMEFDIPEKCGSQIEIFDVTGRAIIATQMILHPGRQLFKVTGLRNGVYVARINAGKFFYSGKLISNYISGSSAELTFQETMPQKMVTKMLKNASSEIEMQYNTGDRLKFTAVKDTCSTIIVDAPTQSKKLTFNLVVCTDADGNDYPVVQIGNQIWMAENLRTTKYRNGDPLPNVKDDAMWDNLKTGAYCNYDNNEYNRKEYGKLYNWHSVKDSRNIAPNGWHIPTDNEWYILTEYLGNDGGKLKDIGTELWESPNTGANNESGFSALPGGARSWDGKFDELGNYGLWWSSTVNDDWDARARSIGNDTKNIERFEADKSSGLSVRCLYGPVVTSVPTVVSDSYSYLTLNSIRVWGEVKRDGGAIEVISKGFCWSTNPNPTLNDSIAIGGNGLGLINCTLNYLTPNTLYYVRAFATNSAGTGYGKTFIFKTRSGIVADIDGNNYYTTIIGNQTWMAQNLKTSRFYDGITIPNENINWINGGKPNWFLGSAGGYYNWLAVNDGKLCPIGWHVPTFEDWNTLLNYLGGKEIAGDKLKDPNYQWTNSGFTSDYWGFTALPGGLIANNNAVEVGENGLWWSSSETYNLSSVAHFFVIKKDSTYITNSSKNWGLNVRCVKNSIPSLASVVTDSTIYLSSSNIAICNGKILDDGGSTITERGFCYSISPNATINDNKIIVGNGTGLYTDTVKNLTIETVYYIKAYAINNVGVAYGREKRFRTSQLRGWFTDSRDGNKYNWITIGKQVWMGKNLAYLPTVNLADDGSETGSGPFYYVFDYNGTDTAVAKATANYATYGVLYNWFAATSSCPNGWHLPTYNEWYTLANNLGGASVAGGKLKETGTTHWRIPNTGATNETEFSGLPGGRRYPRVFFTYGGYSDIAINGYWWSDLGYGTYYAYDRILRYDGADFNYHEYLYKDYGLSVRCVRDEYLNSEVPVLYLNIISSILTNSAICSSEVIFSGSSAITARGICWSTSPNPTTAINKTSDGVGMGNFISNLTGLTANTTYYVRAYATNSQGTGYSNNLIFATIQDLTVTTNTVTDITQTMAICGGNITSDGGATVTARGVCWSTSPNPTTANNKTTDGTGIDTFSSNLTGLTANTLYYVRAYAVNSQKTVYGEQKQFTTSQIALPSVITSLVTNITQTTATGGGNVTSDGGAAVTARGVCWSTTSNPNISNSKTIDGLGTGTFISSFTGLTPYTKYYLRAYAINSQGTVYGNEVNFITDASWGASTVSDFDGNIYPTIGIGAQVWMAENLKTTTYSDGTSIPNITANTAWVNLTTGANCLYDNDMNKKDIYGVLYNWYAVKTDKLCPTGWHVPNDAEWTALADYLGGGPVAGGKLKETGTAHWFSPNTGATNESKFTGLPGGERFYSGGYYDLGKYGSWWSTSEYSSSEAKYVELNYNYSSIYYFLRSNKKTGYSIRCLKD